MYGRFSLHLPAPLPLEEHGAKAERDLASHPPSNHSQYDPYTVLLGTGNRARRAGLPGTGLARRFVGTSLRLPTLSRAGESNGRRRQKPVRRTGLEAVPAKNFHSFEKPSKAEPDARIIPLGPAALRVVRGIGRKAVLGDDPPKGLERFVQPGFVRGAENEIGAVSPMLEEGIGAHLHVRIGFLKRG